MSILASFKDEILELEYYSKTYFLFQIKEMIPSLEHQLLSEAANKPQLSIYYGSLLTELDIIKHKLYDKFMKVADVSPLDSLPKNTLHANFFSEQFDEIYDDRKSDELREHLRDGYDIYFDDEYEEDIEFPLLFSKMQNHMKYLVACESLGAIEDFLNTQIVKANKENASDFVKTTMTVDQIAMFLLLFQRDFCPNVDKAVLQRVFASSFISRSQNKPVSFNSLKNKMKKSAEEKLSKKARRDLKATLEGWIKEPLLRVEDE